MTDNPKVVQFAYSTMEWSHPVTHVLYDDGRLYVLTPGGPGWERLVLPYDESLPSDWESEDLIEED